MLPGWKRAKPYVYSDAEIDALLTAALALPPADGLRRWTYKLATWRANPRTSLNRSAQDA